MTEYLVQVKETKGGFYRYGLTRCNGDSPEDAINNVQLWGVDDDNTAWGDWEGPEPESFITTTGYAREI